MPGQKIRADFEELTSIAAKWREQRDRVLASQNNLQTRMNTLRNGDWEGDSAEVFYAEMDSVVMPALGRLVAALDQAAQTTLGIREVMAQAELDVSALWQLEEREIVVAFADSTFNGVGSPRPDINGIEHPNPNLEYKIANGILFVDGVSPKDVMQGMLGDCWLISSIAAIAAQNPGAIAKMIRQNSDGTFTVTLYERRGLLEFWSPEWKPVEIRIDAQLPFNGNDLYFAQSSQKQELYVSLIEKAYAQYKGGYKNIEGGFPINALESFLGKSGKEVSASSLSFSDLKGYFKEGQAICVSTFYDWKIPVLNIDLPDGTDNPIYYKGSDAPDTLHLVPSHAYYVVGVDESKQTVKIKNPWGFNSTELEISISDFQKAFDKASIAPTK